MRQKLNRHFATGLDTPIMLTVISSIAYMLIYLFAPYIFVADLKYLNKINTFNLFNINDDINYIASNLLGDSITNFYYNHKLVTYLMIISKIFTIISIILIILFILLIPKYREGSRKICIVAYTIATLPAIISLFVCIYLNIRLNISMNIPNNFLNLTVFSKLQPTSASFVQIIISIMILVFSKRILCIKNETNSYRSRNIKLNKSMTKRTKISFIIVFITIPIIIIFGIIFLKNRSFYFISLCIILISMLPFCILFEERKPQAREIVIISTMVVISTMGRAMFSILPNFKPVTAIVIISGIGLGPEGGFLTGAMTAFISNFLFGQGPWTPWQMFAFGIIGFLSGLIFRNNRKKYAFNKIIICLFGGVATFVIYGFIVDTSSALAFLDAISWSSVISIYISGMPINFTHGISTMIFLLILTKPFLKKLDRIKIKYGIL